MVMGGIEIYSRARKTRVAAAVELGSLHRLARLVSIALYLYLIFLLLVFKDRGYFKLIVP